MKSWIALLFSLNKRTITSPQIQILLAIETHHNGAG